VGPVACRVVTELGQATSGDALTDLRAAASLIGREPRLLVMDGCDEGGPGSAEVVEHLLGTCPQVAILATSRVAMGIPGEHVVPLLPFADPDDPRGDTVELLLDRARAMGWDPGPTDRTAAALIGKRTAGVPLAIELGAIELLLPAGQGGPEDEATSPDSAVAAAVGGAIDQLSDATRMTAVRAARLVAGFTTALAAQLVPSGSSSARVLQELIATGLVSVETSGASRRIRFLDRVRVELLEGSSDADDAVATTAVLGLLHAVRPDLASPPAIPALRDAIDELANVDGLLDHLATGGHATERVVLATAAADTWSEDGQWASGARRMGAALDDAPDLDELTRAAAVRAWARVSGTYDGARRLITELHRSAETAVEADEPLLEAHLRLQLANAHGYAGEMREAVEQAKRLRALARRLASDYVDLGVQSLDGVGRLVSGDHEGSRRVLDATAEQLEVIGALSDAARMRRMSSLASRAGGDLGAALRSLHDAERLATAGLARGTLATVRSDLADLQVHVGAPAAGAALEAALDAALAVGNLRAAGLLRTRLGTFHADAATVARGTLDLWFADRRWAAASLVQLTGLVEPGHELRRAAAWAVPAMAGEWGTPLDAEATGLVAAYLAGEATPPDEWEPALYALLEHLAGRGD
jgi:hypothetical protein